MSIQKLKDLRKLNVLVVAGEASGDEHGAEVVKALKHKSNSISFFGMGGKNLRNAGVEIVADSEKVAGVMGFIEVFGKLKELLAARKELIKEIKARKPDVAILIDFPDFNFSLFKTLAAEKVKVVYYISPQVWAWRKGRIKTIKKYVDRVLSIIPFEEKFYRKEGVEANFVGHPFADRPELELTREQLLESLGFASNAPLLALLPGSRKAEIELLLPTMLAAAELVAKKIPNIQFGIPVAQSLDFDWVEARLEGRKNIKLLHGKATELLNCASAAVVASGTVTLDAALAGVPFVIIYKLKPLTHYLAKKLVRGIKYFGMPNLIAGREIVRELLQEQAEPEQIANELVKLLTDKKYVDQIVHGLKEVKAQLSKNSNIKTSDRVAEEVLAVANA